METGDECAAKLKGGYIRFDAVLIERNDEVIYFNPVDLEHPIGFNPLDRVPPYMRHLVADHVVSAFMHIWGASLEDTPRLVYVLYNSLRLLLDNRGSTLLGLQDDRTVGLSATLL
jgi:hypothetical protein